MISGEQIRTNQLSTTRHKESRYSDAVIDVWSLFYVKLHSSKLEMSVFDLYVKPPSETCRIGLIERSRLSYLLTDERCCERG